MNERTTRRAFLQALGVAAVAGVGTHSRESGKSSDERPGETSARAPRTDAYGDPLPDGVRMRLGSSRLRQAGWPRCLQYSPDGRLLVSAGVTGISIWDAASGR